MHKDISLSAEHRAVSASLPAIAHARFSIGDVVRHRLFEFRGVVFDVDPVFANSEEWYEAIPENVRPRQVRTNQHPSLFCPTSNRFQ